MTHSEAERLATRIITAIDRRHKEGQGTQGILKEVTEMIIKEACLETSSLPPTEAS